MQKMPRTAARRSKDMPAVRTKRKRDHFASLDAARAGRSLCIARGHIQCNRKIRRKKGKKRAAAQAYRLRHRDTDCGGADNGVGAAYQIIT